MGKLIYSMLTSLDGYVNDADGGFEWATPDEELHAYINSVSRSVGTCLLGRRMYETMVFWEDPESVRGEPSVMVEYAEIWRGYDKVVYSTTLAKVASERTRIERSFDPDAVRALKSATELNLSIDGPTLAEHALRAGLVDELHVYVCPVVVGGGTAFYPAGLSLDLELLEERAFGNGVLSLQYAVRA
jgi:dihydrofolate reductase